MRRPPARRVLLLLASLLALLAVPASALAAVPSNTAAPGLTGELRVGQTLTATNGTWSPTTGVQFTVTWERCDLAGTTCTTITGASGLKYTLITADLGTAVRAVVRGSNAEGATVARSALTDEITARQPPVSDPGEPPTVSGLAVEGQTLTAADGLWSGPGTIRITRKWQRCDVGLTTCAALAATSATYKLVPADIGSVMRVEVTATNADGSTVALTGPTAVVQGVPPANTTAPTLSGESRDGQTLKVATPGTWSGTATTTPQRYAWERCTASGDTPCSAIAGATAQTYTLTSADIGATVRAMVTQTNVSGSASAPTAASALVTAKAPPVVTTGPSISGTPVDGGTLTAADGAWDGTAPITFTRVWQRCEADGTGCVDQSATGTTYRLAAADVHKTIRVHVVAKNADGTADDVSPATSAVQMAVPVSATAPAVTGSAKEGALLSAGTGTWKGTLPMDFTYGWQRCVSGTCSAIFDATGATYRLTADDVGTTIKAVVTAANEAGATPATSAATAVVTTGPPVNVALPEISGDQPRDGQLYTSTVGVWAGTGTPTFERQWYRCSATGTSCTTISGAIGDTYRLSAADVGKTVRVEITAINAQGVTKVQSLASPQIIAARPQIDGAVTIDGVLRDGQTVSAGGTWTGTQPIAYTYAWQRCLLSCTDIAGATSQTYRLTATDVGARLHVRVGATNAGGGGTAESADSAVVTADPPKATAAPALAGTAREGATLTATGGTFSGTAPLARTYQWERCSNAGIACAPIAGATATTYVLAAADRGQTVRVAVTASNASGSDTATSAVSAVVALAPPANTIVPAVSPDTGLRDGTLLSATTGTWSGSAPMDFTYQWQRCATSGTNCTDIAGAAAATYRLVTADVGSVIRAVVTATNGAGFDTKASLVTGVVGTNPPQNTTPPTLEGDVEDGTLTPDELVDGKVLRAIDGTWTGLVPFTTTYEWQRCDAAGANCGRIAGATASTYRLTPGDVGLSVRARVIRSNAGGTTGQLSEASGVVVAAPPAMLSRPAITGGAAVGRTLSASPGTWAGTPELRFAFQWQRCALDGSACTDIAGAQAATYTIPADLDGVTLRVSVTARNDVGSDVAYSRTTLEVQTDPPVKVLDPTIQVPGLLAQGTIVHADPGTWSGAQPIDFTYQWRRCDLTLTGCTDIIGAVGADYALTKDDVGRRIVLVVRAQNVVADATAQTDATPAVLPEPPSSSIPPSVVTTAGVKDGAKLTANNGSWKGATPMTYTVTWLRCDTTGAACVPATDVQAATYTLTSEDVGHRIRARVAAKNVTDEVSADSAATSVVTPSAPGAGTRPSVVVLDGKASVGGKLRGVAGTFTGTAPLATQVQWQRCAATSTAACDDVPGATSSEYVLSTADVGKRMRLVVTATNVGGSLTAESLPSEIIPPVPPDSPDLPVVVGRVLREGVELSSTAGTWTGSAPLTLGYQWERCTTPDAATCPKAGGITNRPTFTPSSADVGKYVRLTVTGVNAGGKLARSSVAVGPVDGVAPSIVDAPTAAAKGTIKVGAMLTSTTGKWAGTAPLKFETRWQRCNAHGQACQDVDKGTKPTYTLTAEDVSGTLLAHPMRVVVTATNMAGSAQAASASVGVPVPVPTVGAAGDAAAAAAAAARRKALAKPKKTTGRSLAQVVRLKFTPKGRLLVILHCAAKAKTACGARGTVAAGKLRFTMDFGPLRQGSSRNVGWLLTAKQRAMLRGRARVKLRLRLAPPSSPKKLKIRKTTVAVPKAIYVKLRKPAKKRAATKAKRKAATKAAKRKAAKQSASTPPTTTATTP